MTLHFSISFSGRLWLLLNHKILKITCYSYGFARSDHTNLTQIRAPKVEVVFWRLLMPAFHMPFDLSAGLFLLDRGPFFILSFTFGNTYFHFCLSMFEV